LIYSWYNFFQCIQHFFLATGRMRDTFTVTQSHITRLLLSLFSKQLKSQLFKGRKDSLCLLSLLYFSCSGGIINNNDVMCCSLFWW
jgi:hypothetical protein